MATEIYKNCLSIFSEVEQHPLIVTNAEAPEFVELTRQFVCFQALLEGVDRELL